MERKAPLKSYERNRVRTPVGTETLTKQSFQDDCDINKIMARHRKTGVIEHVNPRMPRYGDFSAVTDFHAAMEQVNAAEEEFARLPSAVRSLCENDPELLLRALTDEKQTAALAAAGLPMADDYVPWEEDEKPADEPPEKAPPIEGGE